MPRKVFVAGEILTAADVNTNLMDQAVMVFDDSAARTTAIPTPSEGMVTYLKDTNLVEAYTGAAFEAVSQPKILQVVSTTLTTAFSSASTSFTTVTGLTVSITPSSASSKILVTASVGAGGNATNLQAMHLRLSGGNTASYLGAANGSKVQSVFSSLENATQWRWGGAAVVPLSLVFLDSPATTSSITYGVEGRTDNGGTFFVNRTANEADNVSYGRTPSTITVMEVAD